MKSETGLTAACLITLYVSGAAAQIAVSGNDGKQLRAGDNPVGRHGDTISVLDLSHYPPKLLASLDAPASMIGSPTSVAVAKDSSFAVVTASQKADPNDPSGVIPNDTASVVDLTNPRDPRVVQTIRAGPGIDGVSFNRTNTLALIASNGDDSITLFSVKNKRLAQIDKITLQPKSGPTDVVFSRDGKTAYAVERGGSRLQILAVAGNKISDTGQSIVTGASPYGAVVTPDGKYLLNTNLGGAIDSTLPPPAPGRRASGGGAGARGTVSVVDLKTNRMIDSMVVGATPEHVALSTSGKYAEVTVANSASVTLVDPNYNKVHGLMRVLALGPDGRLSEVASINTGHWCQGATWSKDDKTILLQCGTESDIEVYKFNGKTLTQDQGATIKLYNRGGAIATADSR